jgi:hypothetical protein
MVLSSVSHGNVEVRHAGSVIVALAQDRFSECVADQYSQEGLAWKMKTPKCVGCPKNPTGCFCDELGHSLENGFAMRFHSERCGEKFR